jgi:hypothetical protein
MTSSEWNTIDWESDLGAEDYSNFLTKKMRQKSAARRAAKGGGFFSQSRRSARKTKRSGRKTIRQNRRAARKLTREQKGGLFANLKAKTQNFWEERKKRFSANKLKRQARREERKKDGARSLVLNEQKSISPDQPAVFNDVLPTVTKDSAGNIVKENPDGTVVTGDITPMNVTTPAGENIVIDGNDLGGRSLTFDVDDNPVVEYVEDEVIEIRTDEGKNELVKKDDVEVKGWKSLKKWQKGAIIGGGILVLAGATLLIIKTSKN